MCCGEKYHSGVFTLKLGRCLEIFKCRWYTKIFLKFFGNILMAALTSMCMNNKKAFKL